MFNIPKISEKIFIIVTTILSAFIGLLYIWNGLSDGFVVGTYIVIALRFIYIPAVIFFNRKGFSIFLLFYAILLIFIIAFNKTYLYNNFTGLLAVFIVIMVMPKWRFPSLIGYFFTVTVAFAFNEENLCHYLIHIFRTTWAIFVFEFTISENFSAHKLILYDDEIKILTELSKNHSQKFIDIDGYSESTIYRRIKAASKRNNVSKEELVIQFKKEYSEILSKNIPDK